MPDAGVPERAPPLNVTPLGSVPLYEGNTVRTYSRTPIEFDNPAMSPKDPLVILAQNEGLVLRQPIAMGASGVHRVHVRVGYREL